MIWDYGTGEQKNWMIATDSFNRPELTKYEVNMCQGNGYMCIHANEDERVEGSSYSTLVAGLFNHATGEVTHIQNLPDITNIVFTADGVPVRPQPTEKLNDAPRGYSSFLKTMNFYDGLLTRSFVWEMDNGKRLRFTYLRVVPLDRLHMYAAKVQIEALDDVEMTVCAGIEGIDRLDPGALTDHRTAFTEQYITANVTTAESRIPTALAVATRLVVDGTPVSKVNTTQDGSSVYEHYTFTLQKGQTAVFEKFGSIHTQRDLENEALSVAQMTQKAADEVTQCPDFEEIYRSSAAAWKKEWEQKDVIIDTSRDWDQLAVRFSIYHLIITCPRHDSRMNIGARGLQGYGYNNHTFWDTEIFMLPFFIFTDPAAARKLLEYRYYGLDGAHRKAKELGYQGAMYPWEAAWMTDGETTPPWAASGRFEHHITGDITQAIFTYCAVTGDMDFMERYGYEIMFDTAKYWVSRVTYNADKDRYEILDTIGPDEAREHIDNNAFTNYIAHLNIAYSIKYYDMLKSEQPEKFRALYEKVGLDGMREKWQELYDKMYLPRENEDGIVPQDDTYLADAKKIMEHNRETGKKDQISKQADVMVLFLLFEDHFSAEVKKKNYYFYEPLCYHASSLSRSSYCTLSADIGENDVAYDMFWDASQIDLGEGHDSGDGIHTAAAGGLWQCTVFGFLGVRLYGTQLRIQPHLPKNWKRAQTTIVFQGTPLRLTVDHETLQIERLAGDKETSFLCNGEVHTFADSITLKY